MRPYYRDDWLTVHLGDCRAVMAEMEPESVHCVVTSPPYWGLRDYGTAAWSGGDEGHAHDRRAIGNSPSTKSTLTTNNGKGPQPGDKFSAGAQSGYASECSCGATRIDAQLGLEPTPEAYVANLVAVFREVRRVLRKDGTVWLNLGDSYSQSANTGGTASIQGSPKRMGAMSRHTRAIPSGLKPKDLVGIPWRVAFALQADGWYLRSDIIWAKPNPMPESVTDRPTKSHEYVFLLAKSARYYFDADAVRESFVDERMGNPGTNGLRKYAPGDRQDVGRPMAWTKGAEQGGRNIRSVWTIATAPYPGAHFATFPPKLIEPCIKAGTSERGVCPECGAPWERVVEAAPYPRDATAHRGASVYSVGAGRNDHDKNFSGQEMNRWRAEHPATTTGWRPTCAHEAEPVPATILDPFAGSGTTGLVAQQLGRRAVLIDLSADYLDQALTRNAQTPLGLGA